MKFKHECVETTTVSYIKFEENRKAIVFSNPDNRSCMKIQVDGCQITDGERCDNLLVTEDTRDEYFVELKGVDVEHALKQLDRSVSLLSDKAVLQKKIHSYIICTNVAPKATAQIQMYKIKFKTKYNCSLEVKERRHEVSLQ